MRARRLSKRVARSRRAPLWLRVAAVPLVASSKGGRDVLLGLLRERETRVPAMTLLVKDANRSQVEQVVQELRRAVHGATPALHIPPTPREVIDLDLWLVPQLPIQVLLTAALEDPEPSYRRRAAMWLGEHATRDALIALSRLADADPDDDVRLSASLAMRRIERRA